MEWQVVAVIILIIGLLIISTIVTKLYKKLPSFLQWIFVRIKQTYCCNLLRCRVGIHVSQLNPMCSLGLCKGCTCEYCE
jgi:hypothetical protein